MQIYPSRSHYMALGQITCFIALLVSAPPWPEDITSGFFMFIGLGLGYWSLLVLNANKGRLSVFPDIRPGSKLVTSGPYRFIRHPIYTAITIVGIGLFVNSPSAIRLIFLITLIFVQILKVAYEEKLLLRAFPEYTAYRKGTWRFLPGIF